MSTTGLVAKPVRHLRCTHTGKPILNQEHRLARYEEAYGRKPIRRERNGCVVVKVGEYCHPTCPHMQTCMQLRKLEFAYAPSTMFTYHDCAGHCPDHIRFAMTPSPAEVEERKARIALRKESEKTQETQLQKAKRALQQMLPAEARKLLDEILATPKKEQAV